MHYTERANKAIMVYVLHALRSSLVHNRVHMGGDGNGGGIHLNCRLLMLLRRCNRNLHIVCNQRTGAFNIFVSIFYLAKCLRFSVRPSSHIAYAMKGTTNRKRHCSAGHNSILLMAHLLPRKAFSPSTLYRRWQETNISARFFANVRKHVKLFVSLHCRRCCRWCRDKQQRFHFTMGIRLDMAAHMEIVWQHNGKTVFLLFTHGVFPFRLFFYFKLYYFYHFQFDSRRHIVVGGGERCSTLSRSLSTRICR